MVCIGIIANPAAGKDVRRLVAHGFSVDNEAKVNIVRRVILGAIGVGCQTILIMPDSFHIGARAFAGVGQRGPAAERCVMLDMPATFTAADTEQAARLMQEAGAGCVVTLGGDGTVRLAAKSAPALPLLPISTGTNNVLPTFVEGTVAGMAAALVAAHQSLREVAVQRRHGLVVRVDGEERDVALVDVACMRGSAIGTRAVWDWRPLTDVVAISPRVDAIGLSGIVGARFPEQPLAAWVRLGGSECVLAAIAPGLVASVPLAEARALASGECVAVGQAPMIVALDGERELAVRQGAVSAEVRPGCATLVDPRQALAEAARQGLLAAP